jgi:hypothetical protein
MLGDLPPSSSGNDVVGGVLHDQPPRRGLAGEGDLGNPLVLRQRLAGLDAEAVDDIENAGRQEIGDQLHDDEDAERGLFGGLENHAIAGGERRRQLPRRHQDREIPGNDLTDDAERLVIVIGHSLVIDLRDTAFLGAHDTGEIAPVIDHQRHVRIGRLADRLAVIERLDQGQQVEIGLQLVRDLVQNAGALGHRGLALGIFRLVGRVERQFDVGGRGARHRAELLARDRTRIVEVASFDRGHPFAADEIVVAVPDQDLFGHFLNRLMIHGILPWSAVFEPSSGGVAACVGSADLAQRVILEWRAGGDVS